MVSLLLSLSSSLLSGSVHSTLTTWHVVSFATTISNVYKLQKLRDTEDPREVTQGWTQAHSELVHAPQFLKMETETLEKEQVYLLRSLGVIVVE